MLEKFKYTDSELSELLKTITIVVDKREKVNEHIINYYKEHKIPYILKSLPMGDYTFMIPANEKLSIPRDLFFDKEIMIERKANAEELSGNFAQSRTRFEEEFAICQANKKYLLIENCNYSDIVSGKYNTQYNSKSYTGSLHSFNHKYDLQLVFMPDNKYSPIFIYATFQYYLRNIIK
jgi:hypothetical protein